MRARLRALVAAVLILCMLPVLQQATLHVLVHLPGVASDESHAEEEGLPHDEACGICLAHAALGALPPARTERLVGEGGEARLPPPPPATVPALSRAYSARAPPPLSA